ncbi:oligopeptide/dipeptide ABC transporter ATP-binding protein [Streptomyces sp. NBC_00588]|uniref:oligopeptide/dipeptide ABC transporter ATP-binding protein n=1 Tax=Streptomyces sp. NBC_00588 TaxID=2975784 RepID=UPI002E801E3F|nr:oligopeptide/dipeptide ABC transporter ATP-binding protein [Streptomyces sp. NBC_00588]WUB41175.1 ATP-binding cassette domain-containing protein [Streptomyces sp. NBC_00588]
MKGATTADAAAELTVSDLVVDYPIGRRKHRRAVDGVSLRVPAGRAVGLVGESGSGKSTVAKAVLGMAPVSAGQVAYGGTQLDHLSRGGRPQQIQVVFQDPYSSLDPTKTIGYTVQEPLRAHADATGARLSAAEREARVRAMLAKVGLPAEAADRYPAQFSGGQRQRISIARALILEPRLVICDEAVSALDLSIQAQILNLLLELQQDLGLSLLFITHDLSVVNHIAEDLVVLFRGRVMETGPAERVYRQPQHPYTRQLVVSAPLPDLGRQRTRRERREALALPPARQAPLGESCPFAHRCPFAVDRCRTERPVLRDAPLGGQVACHRAEDLPPWTDDLTTSPEATGSTAL